MIYNTSPNKKDFDNYVNKFYIKKSNKSLLNKFTDIISIFVRQKCLFIRSNIELIKNPYTIVYGHFYNKWNIFNYKKIYRNKIDNERTYKCKYEDLYKEENAIQPENSANYNSIKIYLDNIFSKYKEKFKQTKYKYSHQNKTLYIENNNRNEAITGKTLII